MNDYETSKEETIIRNLKVFAVAAVGVAVLWGIFGFFQNQQKKSEIEAFSALSKVESLEKSLVEDAEVITADPFEALAESSIEIRDQYIALAEAVIDDHSGTTASFMAALRLGRVHSSLEQWDQAEKYFTMLRGEVSSDSAFYVMATEGLAKSHLARENFEAALSTYDGVEATTNTLKPLLMMGRAKVMLELHRKEEAVELFQKVISDFPATPYSREAQALKARASL